MKKTKTLTAAIAALSAITAISASAYAADVIDFEDGNYSFVSMKTDDGGDASGLSVEFFGGSKQLMVDVKDCKKIPKVSFSINSMISEEDFDKVKTIEMDLTLISKDGKTAVGKAEGAVGTQGGSNKPSWGQTTWEIDGNSPVTVPEVVSRKMLLKADKLVNGTADTEMLLMRWACDVDYKMYVDNIKFLDRDGNTIPLALSAASVQTEAVTETEAPAETEPETTPEIIEDVSEPEESAPESDADTTSSTTGNLSAFAAASALVLSFYAVSMTRKKK